VRATSRFDLDALEPARTDLGARSVVVAILHRESLLHAACPYPVAIALLARDQRSFGLYAQLARSFRYQLIEQLGPIPPLRPALELLSRSGQALIVAVDGPAGPSGVAKRGAVELARLSGAPLVPIRCFAQRAVELETTWDRRLVPLPCGVLVPVAGSLLEVPRRATRHDVAELAKTLASTLSDLREPRLSA
jgi:lysophospholipid acyltransferase (LPLAT)-like uncharacterized protein